MSDFPDWGGGGGGGGLYPTFNGVGNPEGVQVANFGQTYLDTSTGIVFGKISSDDDGTADNWGFISAGEIQVGYTDGNTYVNESTYWNGFTTGVINFEDKLTICAGSVPNLPQQQGVQICDTLSPPTDDTPAILLQSVENNIAILAGVVGNTFANTVTIDAIDSTLSLGTQSAVTLIGEPAGELGFQGATGIARQTITGSKGGNVALGNLLTALNNLGLITDHST